MSEIIIDLTNEEATAIQADHLDKKLTAKLAQELENAKGKAQEQGASWEYILSMLSVYDLDWTVINLLDLA